MKSVLSVLVGMLVVTSVSFAQDRGNDRGRDRDRGRNEQDRGGRGGQDRGRDDRGRDDRGRDDRGRDDRDRGNGNGNGGGNRPAQQDYSGAIGPGNFCTTCAFENRADVPQTGKRSAPDRYLVNSDRDSIDARCQELGWDYGQLLERYTYQEWCRYGNAKTRTWDRYRNDWSFGSCRDGNVKSVRCFRR